MTPHGAPTTWFSASWHSSARRSGSTWGATRGRAVAPSSGALPGPPPAPGLREQHGGAEVVGMTGQRLPRHQGAKIGDESIVPHDELVDLAAGRNVLVVKEEFTYDP